MGYYLDETELYYFNTGKSARAYRSLGCHFVKYERGRPMFRFAVWAPNAASVSLVGDFNGWDAKAAPMAPVLDTGVWQIHADAERGQLYKYAIFFKDGGCELRADPYAVMSELRPGTASVVRELPEYNWQDRDYISKAYRSNPHTSPMAIYEVHLGSWKHGLNYRELAEELPDYAKYMGFTHIELLPVAEHPLDMSWGYQVTGYYAITSRYGSPEDFMYFVDRCHRAGLGVILDWVPAHFPRDAHGLRLFDGTPLYEHGDPRRGEQPQWGTMLFDYGRPQVRSFLISNAAYYFREYHIDGLRVDAVSCMLYSDYGKQEGQWLPNIHGGRENLEAIAFIRQLNETIKSLFPGRLMIAEESTPYPRVTGSINDGGLGFDFKWNMGWMNDTLSYMSTEPRHRPQHHDKLTFTMCYAFAERFILPLSHDEVVHGKRSLLGRMPGEYDEKFAQLRLMYAYMYALPGKKLLFMGSEFGQFIEWRFDASLDWLLLDYESHSKLSAFVKALNELYVASPALFSADDGWEGFEWRSVDDSQNCVIAFMRKAKGQDIVCIFNFSQIRHNGYAVRLPYAARLTAVLCSNDVQFGGEGALQPCLPVNSVRDINGCHSAALALGAFEAAYYAVQRIDDAEEAQKLGLVWDIC